MKKYWIYLDKVAHGVLILGVVSLICAIGSSPSHAQSGGVQVVSEDNQRGVVCYAKNFNTEHISCVKVK